MKDAQSFDKMTLVYRRFMQMVAILPFDEHDYNYMATRLLLLFLLITSITQWSSFVSYAIIEGLPSIEFIGEMAMASGLNVRYYLLLWNRQKIASLLDDFRHLWNDLCDDKEGQSMVRIFEHKVRILFYCLFGMFTSATSVYFVIALKQTFEAAGNNSTQTKYLPIRWFVEGGDDMWPGYAFNYAVETITAINSAIITTTVDTAAPLFIMIAAGYFRVLQFRFYRAYDKCTENNDDSEIVICVRLHQRLLDCSSKINNITQSVFFVQLLTTVYNLSLYGIKLSGTDPDRYKYVGVVIITLGQLFLCQWAPDHLAIESAEIATAAYNVSVPWMERQMGKTLVLIIARAQQPVYITAAGFIYLSIENFGEMLKSAVSFFTVLRTLVM